jgi:hypothetical protein
MTIEPPHSFTAIVTRTCRLPHQFLRRIVQLGNDPPRGLIDRGRPRIPFDD